jgi:hypothetical protein
MRPPFAFVDESISHDTIQTLEELLEKAKNGAIIGLAYVVMNKKRSYNVDSAGELHRNPTYALGTVIVLAYKMLMKATGRER